MRYGMIVRFELCSVVQYDMSGLARLVTLFVFCIVVSRDVLLLSRLPHVLSVVWYGLLFRHLRGDLIPRVCVLSLLSRHVCGVVCLCCLILTSLMPCGGMSSYLVSSRVTHSTVV